MLKLFQINSTLNVGSTGHIAEQIADLATSEGWNVWIAHGPRFVNDSAHQTYQICSLFEEKMHGLKSLLFDSHGLGCETATKKLVDKIQSVNPDIIHLHNVHGYYLNYKILFEYLKMTDIPIVWTLHDCWSFTGHCAHFENMKCEQWKLGCVQCHWLKNYPRCIGFARTKRNFNLKKSLFTSLSNLTLVPVSTWQKNLLKESFFANSRNINIYPICNGVDIKIFSPLKDGKIILQNKYGICGEYIVLGVANRWTSQKGLDDIYKLRKILPSEYLIVLIGMTKKQITELPEGIVGIIRTESKFELAIFYSAADVYINPTYSDTFPTVNLESLACGTPVITYRTGGSVESIDENTGLVVEQGNLEELNNAIVEVCRKGKNFFLGNCRKRAEQHFDKNITFRKYINLYNRLLNK